MYAQKNTCLCRQAGCVQEKHFCGFPAVETPQVARMRIPPEFFRHAACLSAQEIKSLGIHRIINVRLFGNKCVSHCSTGMALMMISVSLSNSA
jgi:hypothetical protein